VAGIGSEPDARIDEALSAELAGQPQLFVQIPGASQAKNETWRAHKEDRAWIAAAQKAMEADAYDSAVGKLKKGIAAAWKKPDDPGAIAEAELLLSVAQFRRGNEDEGQKALAERVRLLPADKLAGDYPPLFFRLYEQARKRWQAQAAGAVRVDVDADVDGLITLNGREVGKAPVLIEHVPPGPQLLAFTSGDKQIVRRVEVGTTLQNVRFAVAGPRRNPLARNAFVSWSKAELAALARAEGAAFAVTGAMSANGAGAGHTLAVVLVSASGEGVVVGTAKLADAPAGWGAELNRLGARAAQLAASGFKDKDETPLIEGALPGVGSDGLVHYDCFPKKDHPASIAVAPVKNEPAPAPVAKVEARPQPASAPLVVPKPRAPVKLEDAGTAAPRALPIAASPLRAPEPMPAEIHQPIYKQWWLWTIVGAAVAGGVVAAVVVSTAKVGQVQVNATW
jgi:hypothetical protein